MPAFLLVFSKTIPVLPLFLVGKSIWFHFLLYREAEEPLAPLVSHPCAGGFLYLDVAFVILTLQVYFEVFGLELRTLHPC
jgi:hypothetical protein